MFSKRSRENDLFPNPLSYKVTDPSGYAPRVTFYGMEDLSNNAVSLLLNTSHQLQNCRRRDQKPLAATSSNRINSLVQDGNVRQLIYLSALDAQV